MESLSALLYTFWLENIGLQSNHEGCSSIIHIL